MRQGILIVFHGGRDPEGIQEFLDFYKEAEGAFPDWEVRPAFLEFAEPSVLDALAAMVREGMHRIVVLPLFLVGATHMKSDLPAAIHAARARFPHVEFVYGRHLGVHPKLNAILDERFAAIERKLAPLNRAETIVLLVGRGSSDPDANSDVAKVARLFWEGRGLGSVEVAFSGITGPSVLEGIQRCACLGAQAIIVLPYFLFTGILIKRMAREVAQMQAALAPVRVAMADYLGSHPNLLAVLTERLQEAVHGEVAMSCDRCKHRAVLPGFEDEVGAPQGSDHHHGLRTKHHHGPDHTHHG
jgi:sirohydrochlorin cobaltochelatase